MSTNYVSLAYINILRLSKMQYIKHHIGPIIRVVQNYTDAHENSIMRCDVE